MQDAFFANMAGVTEVDVLEMMQQCVFVAGSWNQRDSQHSRPAAWNGSKRITARAG